MALREPTRGWLALGRAPRIPPARRPARMTTRGWPGTWAHPAARAGTCTSARIGSTWCPFASSAPPCSRTIRRARSGDRHSPGVATEPPHGVAPMGQRPGAQADDVGDTAHGHQPLVRERAAGPRPPPPGRGRCPFARAAYAMIFDAAVAPHVGPPAAPAASGSTTASTQSDGCRARGRTTRRGDCADRRSPRRRA